MGADRWSNALEVECSRGVSARRKVTLRERTQRDTEGLDTLARMLSWQERVCVGISECGR